MISKTSIRADADPGTLWTALGMNYLVLHPTEDRPPIFGSKFMRTLLPEKAAEPLRFIASKTKRDPGELMDGVASWLVEVGLTDGKTGPLAVENGIECLIDIQPKRGQNGADL